VVAYSPALIGVNIQFVSCDLTPDCGEESLIAFEVISREEVSGLNPVGWHSPPSDFPSHTDFVVTMGSYGAKGIGGVAVTTIDSEDGGSFVATYSIPQTLRGLKQIAIRLQSPTGYYSYNWFYNNSTE